MIHDPPVESARVTFDDSIEAVADDFCICERRHEDMLEYGDELEFTVQYLVLDYAVVVFFKKNSEGRSTR